MSLRTKAGVLTVLFVVVFMVLQFVDLVGLVGLNQEIFKAFGLAVLFCVGLYWVLGFNVKGLRFVTILGYSSFLVFIQSLFLELIVFQNIGRISEKTISLVILFLFGLVIYFLILTVNILNVSYISRIPLAQAAKAANFLYTLFGAYFSFLLLSKLGLVDILKLILFIMIVYLLTLNLFWFKKESFKQLVGETSAVVLCMFTLYLVFIMWPLAVEVASMFYTVIFYILLGLGLEERETTSVVMRVEYFVLLVIAILLLLKLAVWGINGPVI
jgi:hypothetical protein